MRRKYEPTNPTYVVGTSAKVLVHENIQEPIITKKSVVKKIKVYSLDPKSTLAVAFSILLMIGICTVIIRSQIAEDTVRKQVVQLDKKFKKLQQKNSELESGIYEAINLDEIRKIAMEEYGMVYPTENTYISVPNKEESYTEQYSLIAVPKDEKITMGNIMTFITRGW